MIQIEIDTKHVENLNIFNANNWAKDYRTNKNKHIDP